MLDCPTNLLYSHRHMWSEVDEDERTALVGISEDLAEELPEILSIDMPMVGDELEMDTDCLHLHMENDILIINSPLTGRVIDINREVLDTPELIHVAPFKHWLYKMEYDEDEELHMLFRAKRYMQFLDQCESEE